MRKEDRNLSRWQYQFYAGMAAIAPISPFLFIQGRITRWKVGLLPDAAAPFNGTAAGNEIHKMLLVIGESTVAGLGARDHERALAGQFANAINRRTGETIDWHVIGRNGVTARRTIDELVPMMPGERFDYILLGLGGNDVMKLSSPRKWRRDMLELIAIMREKSPDAAIFITNCPMIVYSPVIPEPIKSILWKLSRMHDANIREFTSDLDGVHYFPQPVIVDIDGFWADGIHPSEKGYHDWAEAMAEYFAAIHAW